MQPHVIVLPGMDGCGPAREAFGSALASSAVRILSYPPTLGTYGELCDHLRAAIPGDRPCLLIGESFGGPLAVMLAAEHVTNLVGLCLCASFVRYPIRLGALASIAARVPFRAVPDSFTSALLLGRWCTPALRAALRESLSLIEPAALAARIRAAASIDVSHLLARIGAPLLHLRAQHDRVVCSSAAATITRLRPDASLRVIPGPHALLQAQPQACAQAIGAWARL